MKPLAFALIGSGRGFERGEVVREIKPMCNASLFRIATMNPPCTTNIS
jgi:hypothetical protein